MKMIFALISILLFPVMSFAQEVGDIDMNVFLAKMLEAVTGGKWIIAGAGVVLFLVFIFRKYILPKVQFGSGVLPYLSLGLGALFGLASHVFGGVPIDEAIKIVFLSGPLASSLWSAVFKLFLKKD